MRRILIIFFTISISLVVALPPPEGLNLKRAKQISQDGNVEQHHPVPPNLQIRSRMMAALNSQQTAVNIDKANQFAQPLILTKSSKKVNSAKPVKTVVVGGGAGASSTTESVNTDVAVTLSPEDVRKKFTSKGNEKVNLKVRPVLQTNFVDANGKVVHDVVAIPIPVSDGAIHSIPKSSKNATSSSSIVETEKNVNVSFRSSLPLWLV
ncbi:unnamed protein product [Caenorhabditis angaria]|uniref:Uncharacterized protein n=1 Tax=Caenorhabditis angaria TaxID=860376 RepID=A0A9P1N259_9PELO|nr:unnamed protein product [Caenorhabditis angaria]